MNGKQIIRSIAFLLVVFAVFVVLSDLFENGTNNNYDKRFYTYRQLDKDIVDAVFIGTSGVDRYWNSGRGFADYGIAMYALSSDAMPPWVYTNMIEEAFAYQNPQLFLLDVRSFLQDTGDASYMDARGRRVIDAMDFFSINRLKVALKTAAVVRPYNDSAYRETGISYILPFIKYHSIALDEDYSFDNHLGSKPHNYAGFYYSSARSATVKKQKPNEYKADYFEDLSAVAETHLYDLINYIRERKLDALFVVTPKVFDESEMGRLNTMLKILDEEGMPYAFFTVEDDPANELAVNLDWSQDFYNDAHVNYKGANKFTDVLAKYLLARYDLPDRREDERAVAYWGPMDEKINKLMQKYEKNQKK